MELTRCLESGVVLCDGAMATELYARGLAAGEPPEWWNIERPDDVRALHLGYIEAGARVIVTNTFGANRLKLQRRQRYGAGELNRAGVEVARQAAASRDVLILGNMGPTGLDEQLLPLPDAPDLDKVKQVIYETFEEQAVALQGAGADAILIETMSCLAEAELAVRAACESTELAVLCSMSFRLPPRSRPKEFRTYWGDRIPRIAGVLSAAGAIAIGSNCGDLVEEMPELARQMRQTTDLPLIFEVNAGRPRVEGDYRTVYPLQPSAFAEILQQLVDEGARIVGGCCGSTPQHIGAASTRLGTDS